MAAPRPRTLRTGDSGDDVYALQVALVDYHYWLGTVDGVYGALTKQAVYAFQKAQGLDIDGIAGRTTIDALANPAPVSARVMKGDAFEVDKGRQLLLFVVDGQVKWIWNTSTGTGRRYTYGGRSHLADTPSGSYEIYRQIDGWDSGPLGELYRPKYFNTQGIAIHGYVSVPRRPASHGCVRVTMAAIDYIWREDLAPIGTRVLVYD